MSATWPSSFKTSSTTNSVSIVSVWPNDCTTTVRLIDSNPISFTIFLVTMLHVEPLSKNRLVFTCLLSFPVTSTTSWISRSTLSPSTSGSCSNLLASSISSALVLAPDFSHAPLIVASPESFSAGASCGNVLV